MNSQWATSKVHFLLLASSSPRASCSNSSLNSTECQQDCYAMILIDNLVAFYATIPKANLILSESFNLSSPMTNKANLLNILSKPSCLLVNALNLDLSD